MVGVVPYDAALGSNLGCGSHHGLDAQKLSDGIFNFAASTRYLEPSSGVLPTRVALLQWVSGLAGGARRR